MKKMVGGDKFNGRPVYLYDKIVINNYNIKFVTTANNGACVNTVHICI